MEFKLKLINGGAFEGFDSLFAKESRARALVGLAIVFQEIGKCREKKRKSRRKKRKKQDYEGDLPRVELNLSRLELRMTKQALARAKKREVSYVV